MSKKIAIDSYYYSNTDAYTVGVIFNDWKDKSPDNIISCHSSDFLPYIPGEFYKRELPGILKLLSLVNLSEFDTIIVDGFADLPEKPGLGRHLFEELREKINVIGVSKSRFDNCELVSEPVLRGDAKTPLYVNSCGSISNHAAAELIKIMYGKYKLPTLLKILDKETKKYKK